jgi:SAM-dependent methyltransferase
MRDRPTLDLFLISWLILFLELACIRWFPSHVMFLTFFTNIVLLACFVGMSIGCLIARSPTRYLERTPVWLVLAIGIGLLVEAFRNRLLQYIAIGDRSNPDVVFFGAEAGDVMILPFRIPLEVLGGGFFLLIAVLLIGPGQEMGRAFTRVPGRMRAYGVNLLGSLVGIGSFAACSYLQLPPVVWFGAAALGIGYFLFRPTPAEDQNTQLRGLVPASRTTSLACLAAAVALTAYTSGFATVRGRETAWSPYYRIDFMAKYHTIETNLVSHQVMEPRHKLPGAPYANYALPYLLQRDVTTPDGQRAWPEIKRVLIIGAGSGNDVARALQWLPADARIDAVEIDPVIHKIGIGHHPDQPYSDPRVHVELNDGRNFLRRAPAETYDLVIFALVDSLVLHSGYSNLRLESYLFTEEAFRDTRRVLKPTGVCAVYNYFRHGWLAARIRTELKNAFEADPAVFVLTGAPKDTVRLDDFEPWAFTTFLAGSQEVITPLRQKFAENDNWYWVPGNRAPDPANPVERFGAAKPAPLPPPAIPAPDVWWEPTDWRPIRMATTVEDLGSLPVATDDWPFLYVREPSIPQVTWRGIVMMILLSGVLWIVYRPHEREANSALPPDYSLMARSFFLGAGFMLIETKAVVRMALLFGSTWTVNSVVFASILLMSLVGTLYVAVFRPRRLEMYYAGLFGAIALGLAIPVNTFLGLDPTLQILGACGLVFAPIAFAGVVFATSFARSARPERIIGANVAGALVGGLAENVSVLLGFQYLLCVAGGFYLLSAAFGNGTPRAVTEADGV